MLAVKMITLVGKTEFVIIANNSMFRCKVLLKFRSNFAMFYSTNSCTSRFRCHNTFPWWRHHSLVSRRSPWYHRRWRQRRTEITKTYSVFILNVLVLCCCVPDFCILGFRCLWSTAVSLRACSTPGPPGSWSSNPCSFCRSAADTEDQSAKDILLKHILLHINDMCLTYGILVVTVQGRWIFL